MQPQQIFPGTKQSLTTESAKRGNFTQAGVALNLEDEQNALASEKLLEAMRLTLDYSTCTSHPLFFNQLYGGPEPAGIAGVRLLEQLAIRMMP